MVSLARLETPAAIAASSLAEDDDDQGREVRQHSGSQSG
jgi:hypothetical protein